MKLFDKTNFTKFILFVSILLLAVFLRFQFLGEPFERDEGEYAYMGWRIVNGELPYKDVFNQKFPGIHYIYAAIIKFYGPDYVAVRFWAMIIGILSIWILYLLAKRLYGDKIAYLSALFFAVFSGGPYIQGSSANCEPFMNFFIIASFYAFLLIKDKGAVFLFLPGLAMGLAFTIKQVALFAFIALYICLLLSVFSRAEGRPWAAIFKKSFFLLSGFLCPIAIFILYFLKAGIWRDFIDNTIIYNIEYSLHSSSEFKDSVFNNLFKQWQLFFIQENGIIWLLSAFAFIVLLIRKRLKENAVILLWLLFSFISVCSGGRRVRPHYFIQMLPPLCILAALSAKFLVKNFSEPLKIEYWRDNKNVFIVCVLAIIFLMNAAFQIPMYFIYSPYEVSAKKYEGSVFSEAVFIGDYIKKNTAPGDTIFVNGPEPEIYFYAQRKSATKYLLFYPLLWDFGQPLEKQKAAMQDIKNNNPAYIVYTNWQGWHKPKEKLFFEGVDNLISRGYFLDGIVFWNTDQGLKFIFGADNLKTKPALEGRSYALASIYKRSN